MDSATTPAAFIATRATIDFVNPSVEVNAGIWSLCAGTTALLGLRIWCKIHRRHGLWWDDYILIASWVSSTSPALPAPPLPLQLNLRADRATDSSSCW